MVNAEKTSFTTKSLFLDIETDADALQALLEAQTFVKVLHASHGAVWCCVVTFLSHQNG